MVLFYIKIRESGSGKVSIWNGRMGRDFHECCVR